jgi:hypothetical protein
MAKYRKKPVVIDATQFFTAGDHPAVVMALKNVGNGAIVGTSAPFDGPTTRTVFAIQTMEGWHEVTPGDWIITGVKNEVYPCKPDIFEATYDLVSE